MKQIVLTESEITVFIDSLKLSALELKENTDNAEKAIIENMHRTFHYQVVRFFQGAGSSYPKK